MRIDRKNPLSFLRGVLILLILLNFQAFGEQMARSAQAWSWRGLFRPGLYGVETALWVVLFGLSFSSRGQGLWRLGEYTSGSLARWKGWNWLALLALAALYPLARLSASAALIQRFIPHVWLWGHLVLMSALFLWAAWPGRPERRLMICLLGGVILWQAVALVSAYREAVQAAQNPPRPPFVVAYLGGSITSGDGASDPGQTSWRALTSAWLQDQYPEVEVISINAGMPGTGSDLGAFRLPEEVLRHKPDLVFIEFAVNDSDLPEMVSQQGMEGIVRRLRTDLPDAHLFFVYTTRRELAEAYARGDTPLAVKWHARIAQYYGIPSINAGLALWQEIAAGRAAWEDLARDGVHPTDQGYRIYFEAVRATLEGRRFFPEHPVIPLPPPLSLPTLENAHIVPASQLDAPGWKLSEAIFPYPFSQALESDQPEATFSFSFTGRVVGIYWRVAPDAGQVAWAVDGGAEQTVDTWSATERNAYLIFARNLPPGEHKLRLRILPTQNPGSSGRRIRILGMLLGE